MNPLSLIYFTIPILGLVIFLMLNLYFKWVTREDVYLQFSSSDGVQAVVLSCVSIFVFWPIILIFLICSLLKKLIPYLFPSTKPK